MFDYGIILKMDGIANLLLLRMMMILHQKSSYCETDVGKWAELVRVQMPPLFIHEFESRVVPQDMLV